MTSQSTATINRLGDRSDVELLRGNIRASIQADANGLPFALTIWHGLADGTRIKSAMQDLGERVEVGVLSMSQVDKPAEDGAFIETSADLRGKLKLTKLYIEVQSSRLESGIMFTGQNGRQLVVVAGAYPYSLAIRGLGDAVDRFDPEYPLEEYIRLDVP